MIGGNIKCVDGPFKIQTQRVSEPEFLNLPFVFETPDSREFNKTLRDYSKGDCPGEVQNIRPTGLINNFHLFFVEVFNSFGKMVAIRLEDYLSGMDVYYGMDEKTSLYLAIPSTKTSISEITHRNENIEVITLTGAFNSDTYYYN